MNHVNVASYFAKPFCFHITNSTMVFPSVRYSIPSSESLVLHSTIRIDFRKILTEYLMVLTFKCSDSFRLTFVQDTFFQVFNVHGPVVKL